MSKELLHSHMGCKYIFFNFIQMLIPNVKQLTIFLNKCEIDYHLKCIHLQNFDYISKYHPAI